jgi:hypothetical protein
VEHPFATINYRIFGHPRFLLRGTGGAQTEISLAELVYNLKGMLNVLGGSQLRDALASDPHHSRLPRHKRKYSSPETFLLPRFLARFVTPSVRVPCSGSAVLAFLIPSSPLLSMQTLRAASNSTNGADVVRCNLAAGVRSSVGTSLRTWNLFAFKHSSRRRPLKHSTSAFFTGLPSLVLRSKPRTPDETPACCPEQYLPVVLSCWRSDPARGYSWPIRRGIDFDAVHSCSRPTESTSESRSQCSHNSSRNPSSNLNCAWSLPGWLPGGSAAAAESSSPILPCDSATTRACS